MMKKKDFLEQVCLNLQKDGIAVTIDAIDKVVEQYINEELMLEIRMGHEFYVEYTKVGRTLKDSGFFRKKSHLTT